jgi:stage V sporulation protein D (sporulation-specific penicillin-binding protein)
MLVRERAEQSMVRRRMELVFLLFLAGVTALILRLTFVQWVQARGFAELADRMQGRTIDIDAKRGPILDRNGNELAQDVLAKAIAINPRVVRDKAATANRLAELLGLTAAEKDTLREKMIRADERRLFYSQLRRGVERKLAEKIHALAKTEPVLKGLWLEDSPVRVNPSGRDAIQLLGTVNMDGVGIEAIELKFNSVLQGKNGKRRLRVDAAGQPIPESEVRLIEPEDGRPVKLTIDRDVQHFVEAELAKVAKEQLPDSAVAIVMDVETGDILAMASWPTFDPKAKKIDPEHRKMRAITDWFEPGSIFKVFTAAAALEHRVNTHVHCGGRRAIGNRSVGCAHGSSHGSVDLNRMVEQSCNIAAGTLAERVGPKKMYEFLDAFGFQSRTGVEFPGEVWGRMDKPETWRTMRTVNIGFGQGIVATPLQIVAGYAAIGNDGVYNPPRLVLQAPGAELPSREPRRVMSAANAKKLQGHMEAVVVSGTGKNAKIAGYSAAGKTGTAQIAKGGRYGHGYVASFAGFVPAREPKLAIGVSVWHPRRGQYGGTVAAPVFREISRQCVAFLKIPPDAPNDPRDGADRATFYRYAGAATGGTASD